MYYGIITILGGVLAASALIVARKPNAKELIDKLTPYQGWIGLTLFGLGCWMLKWSFHFLSAGDMVATATAFAVTVVNLGVGFLLGFGLISKYALSKNAEALARGQALRQKLVAVQIPLGVAAIALGAWEVIYFL